MGKTVFLFSGQGSQYPEMGKELYKLLPKSKEIFECGSDVLGLDLAKLIFESDDATLSNTKVSQPSIFTVSILALEMAKESGIEYNGVAGHSLGEYGAMVAANILTLEEGFVAIKHRSVAMARAAEETSGGMAAILGSDEATVAEVCEGIEGYVVPVNYNSPSQTVIAGETGAVELAIEKFNQLGKKAIKLAVSAAFHSKLMDSAAKEFKPLISSLKFNVPNVEFYSNLYGDLLPVDVDFPEYLSNHIISPVKFTSQLKNLHENGYINFVELGPNKVLTGLVKKTLKGVNAVNIENSKTLAKALEKLKA